MSGARGSYLKKRLLKLQVGFLLSEGPGAAKDLPIHLPQRLQVESDLFLESLTGRLVLTRTKEGILMQGELRASHARDCDRCLARIVHAFDLPVAELFASPPDERVSAFSVDSNGEIDIAPLLREEVLIEESYRTICRADCRGLSAETGVNLNHETEPQIAETALEGAAIDPRLAVLKQLLQ